MKKILFLSLLFVALFSRAQVPGYLGMKNSFGYEPNVGLAFSAVNSRGNQFFGSTSFLALNVTHTFVYDRIIKRNASFNARFSIYHSGNVFADHVDRGWDPILYQNYDVITKGGFSKIHGFAINIAYRRYRNDLAPLGLYGGYFLGFGSSSCMVHSSATDTSSYQKISSFNPKFGYMYGRQNVFFDKLVVDRGISFDVLGLMLAFLRQEKGTNNVDSSVKVTSQEDFNKQFKIRMYYRDMLTFYIGAKYIF